MHRPLTYGIPASVGFDRTAEYPLGSECFLVHGESFDEGYSIRVFEVLPLTSSG